MKAEDVAELVKTVKTIKEHYAIITRFKDTGEIDRADALDKYRRFNNDHPDFLAPRIDTWKHQGRLVDLGDADNKTIVDNMVCQCDWLIEKSILKFEEEAI